MADIYCLPTNDQIVPDQDDMYGASGAPTGEVDSGSPTVVAAQVRYLSIGRDAFLMCRLSHK